MKEGLISTDGIAFVPRTPNLSWGKIPIPLKGAASHFFVAGASGSGKTVLLEKLLFSALHHPRLNPAWRFLVYDPKQDAIPTLTSMLYGCMPIILNPLDQRGAIWDVHEDIDSPSVAREFASILIPEEKNAQNPFFVWSVQDLVAGTAVALRRSIKQGHKWTFGDLLWLLFNTGTESGRRNFDQIVSRYPDTERLKDYFSVNDTGGNIRATIMATLSKYEPIAAAWQHRLESGQGNLFSFKDWLTTNRYLDEERVSVGLLDSTASAIPVAYDELAKRVAVIGVDETSRTAVDAINRAMFIRFSQLALSRPNISGDSALDNESLTWVVLDEVREAGHLETLPSILNKGRSKGICVAMGFQDIQGLMEAYGENRAKEMIGQCSTFAVLRLRNPATAEWASSLFGEYYTITNTASESIGSSVNISRGTGTERRRKLLDSDFFDLPTAESAGGICGFFECPWKPCPVDAGSFNPLLAVKFAELHWSTEQYSLLNDVRGGPLEQRGCGTSWNGRRRLVGYLPMQEQTQTLQSFDCKKFQSGRRVLPQRGKRESAGGAT